MAESAEGWMARALGLASLGRGRVEPNPLVGAVLVREGELVGEGYHQAYGGPHAEIHALARAGERARGATLYVTLEPCCHQGKTPPCTDALLRAGVARVVAAMQDPFAQVAGRGAAELRAAGVPVDFGPGESAARRLNAPYLTLLQQQRPYVHAKWAMTLDGKIATRTGDSKWISNELSRQRVHELRGRMDAILVGLGTALADDPLLTARPPGARTATRVVLDRQLGLPLDSQLVRTAREAPTLLATQTQDAAKLKAYTDRGCEILQLPAEGSDGMLRPLLSNFAARRWTNLLVEGGGKALGAFADAGLIDEVHVFIAPRLLGDAAALSPLAGTGVELIRDARRLRECEVETLGDDLYLHGWC